MQQFQIATNGQGLYEFMGQMRQWLGDTLHDGLLTLFVRYTSCSLLIHEKAYPEVQTDLRNFFHRLVPPTPDPSMSYLTPTYEGPGDMPAHIKATMMPVSVSIPISGRQIMLGMWQGIYLSEHRNAPHRRRVVGMLSQ